MSHNLGMLTKLSRLSRSRKGLTLLVDRERSTEFDVVERMLKHDNIQSSLEMMHIQTYNVTAAFACCPCPMKNLFC